MLKSSSRLGATLLARYFTITEDSLMKRLSILVTLCGSLVIAGCGPMTSPLPPRLDGESQKTVDDAWEKALAPIDRLDHQVLLDSFVGTGAYQNGVDKLFLRSEKRFSGGLVVMEIHFDRTTPGEDRFEVTVTNQEGKALRRERYNRAEVEKTYRELFDKPATLAKDEQEPPELAEKRAKFEARWAKINEVFPKPQDELK